ncbi:MAG: Tim44 domain-containing protein [Alphaproteobacteria bacterium]|jgi:predicted lipid-binding transport protein (Tim44 family)|nr:Tim44 domain-containing protein [Alphaproteobacteria bacterium]
MNDGFQFIDIIFFAMIAAFLVLRLRGVLGRRDGHEGPAHDPFKDRSDDNVIPLNDHSDSNDIDVGKESPMDTGADIPDDDDPLAKGVYEISALDPNFNTAEFLSGARMAFELILGAYSSGDSQTLKPLLSADVFGNFSQAIRDREQAGETMEDTLVGITSADIVEAFVEGKVASVTVKFVSEQINATRDENGDVVDGNPNAVMDASDFWTFSRDTKSNNPNWTLVATNSLE